MLDWINRISSATRRDRPGTPRSRRFMVEGLETREVLANHAPTLLANRTPVLNTVQEGALAPQNTQIVGTPVTSLAEKSTVLGGKLRNVIDPDLNAKVGIVVTKTDNTNGTWYFSTDTGTTWKAFSNIATGKGLLLSEKSLVYFKPVFGFSGTVSTAITFRAWDQTFGRSGSTALLSAVGGATAYSQQTDTAAIVVRPLPIITPAVRQAVDHALQLSRNCQIPDGAISQTIEPGSSAVWIAPYFASFTALGLLAANDRIKNAADVAAVGRWIAWCTKYQMPDGYWIDYVGTAGNYSWNLKTVDAQDSSCAMFLMVAGRYQQAGGLITPEIVATARKALARIEYLTDSDGLTWNNPATPVTPYDSTRPRAKHFQDNLEVAVALRDAAYLFRASANFNEAKQCDAQANQIYRKLNDFFNPYYGLFANAYDGSTYQVDESYYPNANIQLVALAYVRAKPEIWTFMQKLPVDTAVYATAGAERWVVAASSFGNAAVSYWRSQATSTTSGFTTAIYSFRYGLAIGGLLKGVTFMPNPYRV